MNRYPVTSRSVKEAAVLLLLSCLIFPSTAHAYVDPGSGSVIVTAILGAIGAIGYTFRKYFYRLKGLFTRGEAKRKDR
jgi:hypothetical protein